MKKCSKCGEIKDYLEFYKDKTTKDGHTFTCKKCRKEYCIKNKEHINKKRHDYYLKNKTKTSEINRKWTLANRERVYENQRKWRERNPEKCKEYIVVSYNRNRIKLLKRLKDKRDSDPGYRLSNNVSCLIWKAIKYNKKGLHWEDLLNYNLDDLKIHIEKQFQEGMTWENYGEWSLDHIIPITAFNFDSPDDIDFKRCWALENLQPLWSSENSSKNNKLEKPFQPCLKLNYG